MQTSGNATANKQGENRPQRIALLWEPGHDHMEIFRRGALNYARGKSGLEIKEWHSVEAKYIPPGLKLWNPDAVLVVAQANTQVVQWLLRPGAPLAVNLYSKTGLPSVGGRLIDNQQAAIAHLQQQGYCHLLHIIQSCEPTSPFFQGEWRKLLQQIDSSFDSLRVEVSDDGTEMPPSKNEELVQFLRSARQPIGVVCECDEIAIGFYKLLKQLKLEVPRQVGVVAMEDSMLAAKTVPATSSLLFPRQACGEEAMRQLHAALAGAPLLGGLEHLPVAGVRITARESTALKAADAGPAELVLQYIQSHIEEPLSVRSLAEQFGYSPRTLQRMFQEVYQITPNEAIRAARIERAKELLTATTEQISKIAMQCGFSSISHFNAVFREAVGMSPSAHRKKA